MNVLLRLLSIHCFTLIAVFAIGILFFPHTSLAQSEEEDRLFAQPEVVTWATQVYYATVPALSRNTVEIWKRTGFGYILKPYVAVDWKKFKDDVEEACGNSEQAAVNINVQFDSDVVRRQAVDDVKRNHVEELVDLTASSLRAFPFASLRVVTGAQREDGLSTKERLRLPNVQELGLSNYTTGLNSSVLGTKRVLINDSCDELRTISSRKSLQAHAFITYDTNKISSAYISLNSVSKSKAFVDLLYDEKETGEKSYSDRPLQEDGA